MSVSKQQIRNLLIQAKVMQFFADIFAVFGIFLFVYIYLSRFQNNPMAALHDTFFIVTVLLPFIPAAVMAYIAAKKRREIRTLLEETQKSA